MHILLIAIPLQQPEQLLAGDRRDQGIHITLTRSNAPGPAETAQPEAGTEKHSTTPPGGRIRRDAQKKPTAPKAPSEKAEPLTETPPSPANMDGTIKKLGPGVITGPAIAPPIQQPPTANKHQGAKSKSTVFDPRLARQLEQERNKVQKFKKPEAELMTATGTFIQKGDYCAEIRKVLIGDPDSNIYQDFKIKCTQRKRPQGDIDRLAEKYGIP